jgi:hypothetical protein
MARRERMTDTNTEPEINWGYNCLTVGIHHGRPEALWNLPLLQAYEIFKEEALKELVVDRIYSDAVMFVHHSPFTQKGTGQTVTITQEWAEKTKEIAEKRYSHVLQVKIDELEQYYNSPYWARDVADAVARAKKNKLNPYWAPLHSHDSINMLCRILGTSASIEATKELSEGEA